MNIILNPNVISPSVNPFRLKESILQDFNGFRCGFLNNMSKIQNVSVIIDGSRSMGGPTSWYNQYCMLSQILGDNVEVMHSNMDGIAIHDNKDAETIYGIEADSCGEGFEFALSQCKYNVVIIIGDGTISDSIPVHNGKFIIYWNVQNAAEIPNNYYKSSFHWVNSVVDGTTANGDHAQLMQIETAVFIQQLKLCDNNMEFTLNEYGPRGT